MVQGKPSCDEFIVACIRKVRNNPSNIKEGTKAGIRAQRVCDFASVVYSETEVCEAIQTLLQKGILIAIRHVNRSSGEALDSLGAEPSYKSLRAVTLYVVADGIPQRASRFLFTYNLIAEMQNSQ